MTRTTETYRVWISCLACYADGRLVGEWYDADEAADVTPDDIHHGPTEHEELWCTDVEGGLFDGEISPIEATERARLAEIAWKEKQIPGSVLRQYIQDFSHGWDDDVVQRACDAYMGEYESDEYFAMDFASDTGFVEDEQAWPQNYIDWEGAAVDLMQSYMSFDGHYFYAC